MRLCTRAAAAQQKRGKGVGKGGDGGGDLDGTGFILQEGKRWLERNLRVARRK